MAQILRPSDGSTTGVKPDLKGGSDDKPSGRG